MCICVYINKHTHRAWKVCSLTWHVMVWSNGHYKYFVFSESSILQLEDPDCEEGSNPSCESVFSLNAEKILVRSHTNTRLDQIFKCCREQAFFSLVQVQTVTQLKQHLHAAQFASCHGVCSMLCCHSAFWFFTLDAKWYFRELERKLALWYAPENMLGSSKHPWHLKGEIFLLCQE